jgi:ZIP family zinc transporter
MSLKENFLMDKVIQGIMIPFLGTALGSACVLFMKKELNTMIQRILTGFAAGVMVAASILLWSSIFVTLVAKKISSFIYAAILASCGVL